MQTTKICQGHVLTLLEILEIDEDSDRDGRIPTREPRRPIRVKHYSESEFHILT